MIARLKILFAEFLFSTSFKTNYVVKIILFLTAQHQTVSQDMHKIFEYVYWYAKIFQISPKTIKDFTTVIVLFEVFIKTWNYYWIKACINYMDPQNSQFCTDNSKKVHVRL